MTHIGQRILQRNAACVSVLTLHTCTGYAYRPYAWHSATKRCLCEREQGVGSPVSSAHLLHALRSASLDMTDRHSAPMLIDHPSGVLHTSAAHSRSLTRPPPPPEMWGKSVSFITIDTDCVSRRIAVPNVVSHDILPRKEQRSGCRGSARWQRLSI